jgi:hypothetical protein
VPEKQSIIRIIISDREDFYKIVKKIGWQEQDTRTYEIFFLEAGIPGSKGRLSVFVIIKKINAGLIKKYLNLLASMLSVLLEPDGIFRIHGAYILNKLGGILITGKTGSGKSTFLNNVARSSFYSCHDHYCLIAKNCQRVKITSPSKLIRPSQLKKIVPTAFKLPRIPYESVNFKKFSFRRKPDVNIIIFPQISPSYRVKIVKISKIDALRRLIAYSSASYNSTNREIKQNQVELLRELSNQCRSYILLSGREMLDNPSFRSYDVIKQAVLKN